MVELFHRSAADMRKKIVILFGHPDKTEGTCCGLADAYEAAAREAGHTVTRFNVGDMHFDPILHAGYRVIQELEPELLYFQKSVTECDHLIVFYPNWWCTMPALLKGLFDRVWLPGFAFRFRKDRIGKALGLWERLMKGKTAHVVVTAATRPIFIRILFGDFTNEIRNGILRFSGFKTRVSVFGPAEKISEARKEKWIARMRYMGREGI